MVKTRRSNGENGEVVETTDALNDVGSVSDDKPISNWVKADLKGSEYSVTRNKPRWPNKYSRRLRAIKMSRIVFPESDTEPEKYSRRSRQVRVFFAGDTESTNTSVRLQRSRGPRKNYMEDSEDKPIQQNVRRSARKRKLLHHSFNESWITNELKVRGYPGLTRIPGFSTSDESSSGEETRQRNNKKSTRRSYVPTNTDDDTQSPRQTRNSSRFSTKKNNEATESESDEVTNQTVIEKKPTVEKPSNENDNLDTEDHNAVDNDPKDVKPEPPQADSESNQCSSRPLRSRRAQRPKKDYTVSESDMSDSDSEIVFKRQPRRSNRNRKPKPSFVEIAPRQAPKTFTIRKKPYSLRERKPTILRRKNIRSQSPNDSSSSTSDSDSEEELNVSVKNKTKGRQKSKSTGHEKNSERALREIQPVELDGTVRFSSVGGLEEHIKCLREMVLFPLMYPDLFHKYHTRPAKGVLFHGPPGTGKTLLARALANECSMVGGKKVAFFMRKGADCLKKWVGESERHLKLLFQQANKMKPSIIFFDEIDALAPVRSVRQEQVHTSVVGTLLAEMDGLCDRGSVVVIGATNRLDAIDPALRRAGRFDRELYFPSPHAAARNDILHIHTAKWSPAPTNDTLMRVAKAATGYGGSDLKALCSESVLRALRRVYPQVYESERALIIDSNKVEVTESDMLEAMHSLVAAGARSQPLPGRPLPTHTEPLLQSQVEAAQELLKSLYIPPNERRFGAPCQSGVLLIQGACADSLLAPAILSSLEHCAVRELATPTLHAALAFTPEQALLSVFSECRRADRGSVLFVRDIRSLWSALGVHGANMFQQLWRSGAAGDGTLLLATCSEDYAELPREVQDIFPAYKECVYRIREPNTSEVINFLKPLITELPLIPPVLDNTESLTPLPIAPPPPPPQESPAEIARKKRKEDYKLRELRIFLRDICRKLASNRRFYKFTKPVDLEEVTDYLDIVKQPMDLETMMTKVDMHKYNCAKEFLDDVDLICANALEYNPDSCDRLTNNVTGTAIKKTRTSSDKQIRHEACSLRDHAHALIEVEMDSDFELECREIAKKRQDEGTKDDTDVPDFIYTASNLRNLDSSKCSLPSETSNGVRRKRRKMNAWSKGLVAKRPRTQKPDTEIVTNQEPKKKKHVIWSDLFQRLSAISTPAAITDEESKENKPVTSTPISNGARDSEASSDDAPLRTRTLDTSMSFRLTAHDTHTLYDSPTKASDRIEHKSKTSPKKRISGNDEIGGTEKVLINKTELDNIVCKIAKPLRSVGLEALIELHSQIYTTIDSYAHTYDRTRLPSEIMHIVQRYIHHLAKK